MGQINETELQAMGYKQKFDYSQYSHDNDVNVIPKKDFKRLIRDTFKTITDIVKETYGPYGSLYTLNELNQTSSTKDGYNTFEGIHFSHQYKQMVKLTIGKICSRVNEVVGDGTTSCLLLADKIFDSLNETMQTPEDERLLADILKDIQKFLNDSYAFATDYDYIKPLTQQSLESVIMMAANHDRRLRDTIINALDVKYDSESNVTSINNVVVQSRIDPSVSNKYDIHKMPGKYHVETAMPLESLVALSQKQDVVLITYDHNFNDTDWDKLKNAYVNYYCLDKTVPHLNDDGTLSQPKTPKFPTIVICATGFNKSTIDQWMNPWLQSELRIKHNHNFIRAEIKGVYPRNEIRDLAAVANIECHTTYTPNVNSNEFNKTTTVSVYNNDCLCLYNVEPPKAYIESINVDMQNEESTARRAVMKKRIDALMMSKSDTIINITVPNSLEEKMIIDKIDDCLSIIDSAFEHGCVPNLFKYAHTILGMYKTTDDRTHTVVDNIIKSIEGIFNDVWISKYGPSADNLDNLKRLDHHRDEFYKEYNVSYDIIKDEFIPMENLATSVQYDVEVVCATLEIVKFLLTSRGLIFDSCLLQMHGDKGTYVPV